MNIIKASLLILISLIIAAVVLDLNDKDVYGIWFLIVIWIIFGKWEDE